MKISSLSRLYLSVLCLFLAGCAKENEPPEDRTFRFNGTINIDGISRSYLLNLPPDYYESDQFSLVIAMHGGGGHAEQFEASSGLTGKANSAKFIVVYPDGVPGPLKIQTWNAGGCCGFAMETKIDDIKFISQLIDKLVAEYKINPKKIYATGHSNGGMMSYRLACELSGKIAAIAPNSSTMVVSAPCNPSRPVPVLHMHSEKDTNVPYKGGYGTGISNSYSPPLDSVLNVWSMIDACGNPAQTITQSSGYTFKKWSGCLNNTSINYYLTTDGGHAWPGGSPGSLMGDTPSKSINANDLLWDFFQQYQLP
ncbi:MAG TPA: PHB depolymerase family esterase [Flavitalea sp.]|nr:PHB depolymerase family esterase [Flavitalea sp.]